MRQLFIGLVIVALMAVPALAQDGTAQYLQDISVTVKSPNKYGGEGQGSGVLITRELKLNDKGDETVKVNFVWTAAHVVDNLRSERTVVDPKTGTKRQIVEFRDAQIVQELRDEGRRVGEIKMDAKVIRYSDATTGEDLAILMVRKRGFVDVNATFYKGEEIPPIGAQLYHVGSLLGQVGSNSMTAGIISQHGRVLQLGSGDGTVFDQTTATAFPGSSGGGVYFGRNEENEGQYIGMLVRGAGEGFNLIVPIRRMKKWASEVDAEWALCPEAKAPTVEQLKKARSVEDVGVSFAEDARLADEENNQYKFWLHNVGPQGPITELQTY